MNTSNHQRSSISFLALGLLSFAWLMGANAAPAIAQSHPLHSNDKAPTIKAADIVRDPSDLPPPVGDRAPAVVKVTLTSKELVGALDPASGTTYRYWTFDGKLPGPFIRVRQGDTVEVTLVNPRDSTMVHSVDLHAVIGPGGGAALLQVPPGQSKTFTFQATTPGLFVYHCGSPMIAQHIANGMFGLILVEPPGGLPHVDHEYYVMQSEFYTTAPKGKSGLQQFSVDNLMAETAQYYLFNGAVDSLTKEYPLRADEGQTVRIFFGNAGPNATASMHMVGEIFTRYYQFGSLSSPPLEGVQTATIPPGDAGIFEVKARVPGQFTFMDHAISRMEKGNLAFLEVKGPENTALVHAGPATVPTGTQEISGVTVADVDEVDHIKPSSAALSVPESAMNMPGMNDMPSMVSAPPPFSLKSVGGLLGCLVERERRQIHAEAMALAEGLSDGSTALPVFAKCRPVRSRNRTFRKCSGSRGSSRTELRRRYCGRDHAQLFSEGHVCRYQEGSGASGRSNRRRSGDGLDVVHSRHHHDQCRRTGGLEEHLDVLPQRG